MIRVKKILDTQSWFMEGEEASSLFYNRGDILVGTCQVWRQPCACLRLLAQSWVGPENSSVHHGHALSLEGREGVHHVPKRSYTACSKGLL